MRNLRYTTMIVLVLLAVVAAACSPSSATNNNAPAATTAPSGASSGAAATSAPAGGAAATSAITTTTGAAATTAPAGAAATTAPAGAAATSAMTTTAATATSAMTTTGASATSTMTTTTGVAATSAVTSTAGAASATVAAPGPESVKTIQVESGAHITFSGWGDQTEQQIYRDSIARFEKAYPNVKVDYQPIPSDFQTKLKAAMAGGTAPDVFYVDDQLMSAFGPSNQLLPLDDYMSQAGVSRKDFIPQLMDIFTLNGKTYGLPKDWGTLGLVYLPDAFKAAGIAEPTASWTWDDLQKAADAINKAGKIKGYCMAADWARFAPFVFQNGGDYATRDGKTAKLNTPEVQQAATFIANMKQSGSLVQPSDVGASWCGEAIGKQLVAMTYEGGWMVNFMRQSYANVNWQAVPLPAGPKGQADIIFTNAIGVNAHTKFPKASAALALFITGAYNQAEIAKTGFAYPTHPDEVNLIQDPQDKAIITGGLWKGSSVAYWGPNTGKLEDVVSKALERIYLGANSVQQSFTQAQSDGQAALNGQ